MAVAAALVLLAGCAGSTSNGHDPTVVGSQAGSGSTPAATAKGPPPQPSIRLGTVVDGLDRPLFITHAGDGSGTLYVVEQGGKILPLRDGKVGAPVLDLSGQITSDGERGLLGLAFAPDFATTGRIYVDYTDLKGDTHIATAVVGSDGKASVPVTILTVQQPYANHNGGMLAFGPDGDLYIGMGDGGSGGDPQNHAQDPTSLLGKILRIQPTLLAGVGPSYTSPDDNPYAHGGGAPEVWDLGLRNPWRFSFDRTTGDLWVGDVGQSAWEEVDLHKAGTTGGVNWGWRVREGAHPYTSGSAPGAVDPLLEYDHSNGRCAVTGGYVAHGSGVAALDGWYLYADYCSGELWGYERITATNVKLLDTGRNISSFGEDETGGLYVCDLGGAVLRVVAAT